jgi:hypothetical protein
MLARSASGPFHFAPSVHPAGAHFAGRLVRLALALLELAACAAVACPALGTSVRDNEAAATLLLPYFAVSRNGIQPGTPIPASGADTVFRVLNVGATGLIVRVEVWNKYGSPVFGFNVPMASLDVFRASMRDILNGHLNVNPLTQSGSIASDPCGLNQTNGVYAPATGFGATKFVRFSNPSSADAHAAISRYQTPAFSGPSLAIILDSLDECAELTSFTYPPPAGALDADNPASLVPSDGVLSGDFGGYVTVDVVNYCTEFTPKAAEWAGNDAIATVGWSMPGYTPNVLIGSYQYVDASCGAGELQAMPGLEFDATLSNWAVQKTFYGRFSFVATDSGANGAVPAAFRFVGDARKPLVMSYQAEFQSGAQGHLTIWRSDVVSNPGIPNDVDLAHWYVNGGPQGYGFADAGHQLLVTTYDDDSGPSGSLPSPLYAFLQTQRYALPPSQLNPGVFAEGWMNIVLPGGSYEQAALRADRKFCSGDPNGDGLVSVLDVFYLINFLFAGGPAPK